MKSSLKFISILLVLLSFVYSIYICYLCFNNAFEGAKLKYNSHNQLVVIEVEEHSLAEYAGLKKGDILLEIDGKSITKKREPAEDILSWAYSVTVKRDAEVVDINTKETFLGYDIFFVFLIPVTFYLLCLFCIFSF